MTHLQAKECEGSQKLGRSEGPLVVREGEKGPPDISISDSGRINGSCFKPLNLWYFAKTGLGN
jgi:hypothetical protein